MMRILFSAFLKKTAHSIRTSSVVPARSPAPISGQPGQIAVVILLIMAVFLVLGLSLAARTTQEIQLSGQEQDSTRVFNAAETGVEKALSNNDYFTQAETSGPYQSSDVNAPSGIDANFTITAQSGLTTNISEGSSATVHLQDSGASSFTLKWAKNGEACNNRASIIIALYYENGGSQVQYVPIKPNCSGYDAGKAAGFSTTGVTEESPSNPYTQSYTVSFTSFGIPDASMRFARIKPLYASTDITVSGVGLTQAFDIRSEAAEEAAVGQATVEKSAIQVTRTKPAPPVVLEYALYSGGSLIKD